ncbi:MAG: DRTGG domain-containing protein [Dehalococcoidia bacterium]|nr:DRTGG domain-containing protein [Dehalococcoidia bacterium]|tara:strand:- start:517 stop:1410 length:894 start_codon:yes stop_codon:yes gene_type:complete
MPVICISSSEKDSGKTAILSGIVQESLNRGIKTYVGELENNEIVDHKKINQLLELDNRNSLKNSELIFVEINQMEFSKQKIILDKFDAKVIFIERDSADINSIEKFFSERLVGFIINGVLKYKKNVIESLHNEKVIAILEEQRFFMTKTAQDLRDVLSTKKVLGEESLNKIIENYLIGGFVLDWGPEYFSTRKNVALVVRGDRPDVQLSALQSGTLNVLIATSGISPVEYIIYEAKKLSIPVLIVDENTEEAISKLSDSFEINDFDHNEKVMYSNRILNDNLNFDKLFDIFSTPITK